MVDKQLFQNAKEQMLGKIQGERGIGTLSEKSVHSVLKYYYAPDEKYHEIKVGTHFADACMDGEIYEIQTRQFYKLNGKLDEFINTFGMDVTIVYPVSVENTILWIDPETGEVQKSKTSKTPKKIYKIYRELYGIRDYLDNPKLHLCIACLQTEDYRLLDGYGKDKKKRATKTDKIPVEYRSELCFDKVKDAASVFPVNLPEEFTVADFKKATGLGTNDASVGLLLFYRLGMLERRKEGRSFLYKRIGGVGVGRTEGEKSEKRNQKP